MIQLLVKQKKIRKLREQFSEFSDVQSLVESLQPNYSVYCIRPSILEEVVQRFIAVFPGTVAYAVKCNPHPLIIDALYRAGIREFDVASESEVTQIHKNYRDAKIHFMHPVKSRAAIKSAYSNYGIRHFAIDHQNELEKILEETGGDGVVIMVRIKTPPSEGSLYHLAKKFGAEPEDAAYLLTEAVNFGCKAGITFHVGSQCIEPKAYGTALDTVGEIIESAGIDPVSIDVGGGFPVAYPERDVPPLEDFMLEIKNGLNRIQVKPQVQILAEPGRALVASGCSLLTQVHLRKEDQLYINDGIYGALSELVDSENRLLAQVIRLDGSVAEELQEFHLNGPTCDSFDMLPSPLSLPTDISEGDWIEIDQVGAYSSALATRFNGFCSETFSIVYDDPQSYRRLPR
jgi:ornithine decarboxylase